jgi:hypothetical protein
MGTKQGLSTLGGRWHLRFKNSIESRSSEELPWFQVQANTMKCATNRITTAESYDHQGEKEIFIWQASPVPNHAALDPVSLVWPKGRGSIRACQAFFDCSCVLRPPHCQDTNALHEAIFLSLPPPPAFERLHRLSLSTICACMAWHGMAWVSGNISGRCS